MATEQPRDASHRNLNQERLEGIDKKKMELRAYLESLISEHPDIERILSRVESASSIASIGFNALTIYREMTKRDLGAKYGTAYEKVDELSGLVIDYFDGIHRRG